jgi:hypothetical protein
VTRTEHPLIQRAKEAEFEWPILNQMLQQLEDACERFDHNGVRLQLQKLVREYAPSSLITDHVWNQEADSRVDPAAEEPAAVPHGALYAVPNSVNMTA